MHVIKPLVHKDATKGEETLQKEMQEYFDKNPALKFQAGLLMKIFELIKASSENDPLTWWSFAHMREIFPVSARLSAVEQRPSLRQNIVCGLTGLKFKTTAPGGKYGTVDKQTEIVDAVLDDGDTELAQLEAAFSPEVWAVYIFGETFWRALRTAMNNAIVESGPREKAFIAYMIETALEHGLIKHLDIRTTLDPSTWQKRIPIEKRVEVDRARIKYEHENKLADFTARIEMELVGFQTIVDSFDSTDFGPVINAVGEAMGFNIEGVVIEEASPKA